MRESIDDAPIQAPIVQAERYRREGDKDQDSRTCELHGEYIAQRYAIARGWSPWSHCEVCEEAKLQRLEERRAAEAVECDRRRRMATSGLLLTRFAEACFDSFDATTPAQRKVLQAGRTYARTVERDSGAGLFLIGNVGTGKTLLASAMAREVILGRGLSARIIGARALIRELRATWERDSEVTEDTVRGWYVGADVLVLDDLGTGSGTEAEQAQLLDVVDGRYVRRRPTIVTSNLNLPQLQEAIGERAFDRLREGARTLVFDWLSHRRPA